MSAETQVGRRKGFGSWWEHRPGSQSWIAARKSGTLPAVLSAVREHAGLSLAELESRITTQFPDCSRRIDKGVLHRYEAGRVFPPSERVSQIASVCGCFIVARPDGTWSFWSSQS